MTDANAVAFASDIDRLASNGESLVADIERVMERWKPELYPDEIQTLFQAAITVERGTQYIRKVNHGGIVDGF